MTKWPKKSKLRHLSVVFGQNGCVHCVLRSILSQKRPGRPSNEVWEFRFFQRFFGHLSSEPGSDIELMVLKRRDNFFGISSEHFHHICLIESMNCHVSLFNNMFWGLFADHKCITSCSFSIMSIRWTVFQRRSTTDRLSYFRATSSGRAKCQRRLRTVRPTFLVNLIE